MDYKKAIILQLAKLQELAPAKELAERWGKLKKETEARTIDRAELVRMFLCLNEILSREQGIQPKFTVKMPDGSEKVFSKYEEADNWVKENYG